MVNHILGSINAGLRFTLFRGYGKRGYSLEWFWKFRGKNLFNLGFADYDAQTDRLLDETASNNGDHYRVFNTVLNTIPDFFAHFPAAIMTVQGSDSRPDFIEHCMPTCTRKCPEGECRNAHRRINIYRRYVDRNYDELTMSYTFYGGQIDIENQIVIERYSKGKKYDAVFVSNKFVHL